MISRVIKKTVALDAAQKVDQLDGPLYQLEESGHTFEITCLSGGTAAAVSGTVSGRFLRADETTVYFTGTLSGNVASITLPQSCYNVSGRFGFVVFISGDDVTTAVYAVAGNVYRSTSDTIIDPTGEIPSLEELMAQIEACEEATDAATAAAAFVPNMIAPAFDASVANAAGDYVTYSGKLYRITADRAANVTWANTSKTEVTAGGEMQRLDQTSASMIESVGSDFEAITGNRAVVFRSGYYRVASSSSIVGEVPYFTPSNTRICAMIKYTDGDVITAHVYGPAGVSRAYFYCDANMAILSHPNANVEINGVLPTPPSGTAYILLNNNLSNLSEGYFAYKGTSIAAYMDKAILTTTGKNTKITTGSDLNDITDPGSYSVQNATVAASISNIPFTNSGGRLLVVGTSSNSNYYQMYFPAAGSPYAFIRYTTGSWYTVDLTITRKTDGSDMGTIISNRLTSVKTVKLGPYDYYVSGINMPDGSSLIGCGPKTRIILMDSVTTGAAIKMGSGCNVSNLSVVGSETDLEFDTTGFDIDTISIGTRHGILWLGDVVGDDSGANMHSYGSIDNVRISSFTGGGIVCENSGYKTSSGINATNCIITNCGAGINVSYWSEYSRFVNINANNNFYGCINNGGNNVFAGCSFSGNHVGMYMNGASGKCVRYDGSTATGRNMGHGSAVGCVFNHNGLGDDYNAGYAVYLRNIDSGFTFDGCQIFYGKIFGRASAYVMFTDVNFGNNIVITIYTPATYMFSMCFFRPNLKVYPYNANTGEKWTTFNSDGNLTRMKFLNCYNSDGTSVTVKSASEATEAADSAV